MIEWVQAHLVAGTPVWAMLGVTFVAALFVPFGAEVAVAAIVKLKPELYWPSILVAALGHTTASMGGFALGYLAKATLSSDAHSKYGPVLRKWGAPSMVLTAVPGIGDPFAVVAGWMRLHPLPSTLWCAAAKLARFCLWGAGVSLL